MKLKLLILIPFGMITIFITGCWDRTEVNDLAIVRAAAIDKKGRNGVELTLLLFDPTKKEGGGTVGGQQGGQEKLTSEALVMTINGINIADAVSKLQEGLSRRIFWGHAEIFVFGEQIAKQEVNTHIDYFMRYPQIREGAYVFVSQGKAMDVLKRQARLERNSAEQLRKMALLDPGLKVTLKDFALMLASEPKTAIAPLIQLEIGESDSSNARSAEKATGAAIFKNGTMIGQADRRITRGIQWLRNEIKQASVTNTLKEERGYISVTLIKTNIKLIPHIDGTDWSITAIINVRTKISQNGTNLSIKNTIYSNNIEKIVIEDIENKITAALKLVQNEMKADVLGFSDVFRRQYPESWRQVKDEWDEVFPTIKLNFNISSKILSGGMSNLPGGLPEDEVKK